MAKFKEEYTDDWNYNWGENDLFFKMLPNWTFKFEREKCSVGKKLKEHLITLDSASNNNIICNSYV